MGRFAMKHVATIIIVAVLTGCSAKIPNKVGPEEYALYSEWMQHHYSKNPPSHLYVRTRTFLFDPLSHLGCGNAMHDQAGVPWSLIKQLHSLGEAEYLLHVYPSDKNLRIPWKYDVVDSWPLEHTWPYTEVSFSRVAFNRAHDEALFGFNDGCGGDCGNGGAIYAHKKDGKWTFKDGGCIWIS